MKLDKIYGLFEIYYDPYEHKNIVCCSSSKKKLFKYFENMDHCYPLAETDDEHNKLFEDHFIIDEVEII